MIIIDNLSGENSVVSWNSEGDITKHGINGAPIAISDNNDMIISTHYLLQNGTIRSLKVENYYTQLADMNNAGQVVGRHTLTGNFYGKSLAFLYDNGTIIDLSGIIGSTVARTEDINNSGQIVGYINSNSSNTRAFYLNPVCQPDFNGDGVVNIQDVLDANDTLSGVRLNNWIESCWWPETGCGG